MSSVSYAVLTVGIFSKYFRNVFRVVLLELFKDLCWLFPLFIVGKNLGKCIFHDLTKDFFCQKTKLRLKNFILRRYSLSGFVCKHVSIFIAHLNIIVIV